MTDLNANLTPNVTEVIDSTTATDNTGDSTENNSTTTTTEPTIDPAVAEFVKKEAQREADRVRTEYSKKLKEKEVALEELKKSMMDAETRAKYEAEQKQKALEERALELEKKNAEYITLKALVDSGLNPEFKDFIKINSSDELEVIEAVTKFKNLFTAEVSKVAENKIKGMANNVAPVQQQQAINQPRQTVVNSNDPMAILRAKRSV